MVFLSGAVKASLLFWVSSCLVLFILFGSLSGLILTLFTHHGATYHCTGRAHNQFVMNNAKMQDDTFWALLLSGAVSSGFALVFLGVFMVLVVVVSIRLARAEAEQCTRTKEEASRQRKLLEECCINGEEKEKLLCDYPDEQVQMEQAMPQSTLSLPEWWQAALCIVLECICFVLIFTFFVSWMFISRDVAFFPSTLPPRMQCHSPAVWTVLNIVCFGGVCSWFFMGMWVVIGYLLIKKWNRGMDDTVVIKV